MVETRLAIQNVSQRDRDIIAAITRGESERSVGLTYGFCDSWLSERLATDPVFSNALYEAQRAELRRGASIGIKVLIELASEDAKTEAGKKIKADAAKALVQYGGHSGQASGSGAKPAERTVDQLTLEEIEQALEQAKRKAGDGAVTIDQTPAIAQDSAQQHSESIDILS